MAFDEGDKAIIRQISFEAAEHTYQRVQQSLEDKIVLHRAECPVAKEFEAERNRFAGGWKVIAILCALFGAILSLGFQAWEKLKH